MQSARWHDVERSALPATLTQFLEEAADRFGDRTLVDFFEAGERLTYRELVDASTAAAGVLARLGLRAGDYVGVVLPNVALFPVVTFALARLGAVAVPINPQYTAGEIDYVVGDSAASWIVIHESLTKAFIATEAYARLGPDRTFVAGQAAGGVGTDLDAAMRDVPSTPVEPAHAGPTDLVNLQYTSGTTGFPKACRLTHDYWIVFGHSMAAAVGSPQRILSDSPYFYMQTPSFLVTAMASGGQLLVPARPSIQRFLGWLRDQQPDFCYFPNPLLKVPPTAADRDHGLQTCLVHRLSPDQIAGVEQRFGVRARDAYASSEVGLGSVVPFDMTGPAPDGGIGVAAAHREFKIVGADLTELGANRDGEICVRGRGMFDGYHGRPETNREVMLDGGWFRTGDIGRMDETGMVYFAGRAKDMIKRSGENISAYEVEHVLLEMSGVAEAAVIAVPDELRDEEVKAVVVLAEGMTEQTVSPQAIQQWCASRLAPFKVPRYLQYERSLPKTPSDKVAKTVLVDAVRHTRDTTYDLRALVEREARPALD